MSRGECFRCGERGHWAADCDKPKGYRKPPKCGYCGERGHTKRGCAKRKADEAAKAEARRKRADMRFHDPKGWEMCGKAVFAPKDSDTRSHPCGCGGRGSFWMGDQDNPCGHCANKRTVEVALALDAWLSDEANCDEPIPKDFVTGYMRDKRDEHKHLFTHANAQALFPDVKDDWRGWWSAEESGSFLRAWWRMDPKKREVLAHFAFGVRGIRVNKEGIAHVSDYGGGYARGIPIFDILTEWTPDILRGGGRIQLTGVTFVQEDALLLHFTQHRGNHGGPFTIGLDLRSTTRWGAELLDMMDEAEAQGVTCEYTVMMPSGTKHCTHCGRSAGFDMDHHCPALVEHNMGPRPEGENARECVKCGKGFDFGTGRYVMGLGTRCLDRRNWDTEGRIAPDAHALRNAVTKRDVGAWRRGGRSL